MKDCIADPGVCFTGMYETLCTVRLFFYPPAPALKMDYIKDNQTKHIAVFLNEQQSLCVIEFLLNNHPSWSCRGLQIHSVDASIQHLAHTQRTKH